MFPNFRQSLSSIGTGNMSSESYVEAKTVLDSAKSSAWRFLLFWREKKLSRNFTVFWNNRRLIGGCFYSLVLARGLFFKRFPSLAFIHIFEHLSLHIFTFKHLSLHTYTYIFEHLRLQNAFLSIMILALPASDNLSLSRYTSFFSFR